MRFPLWICAAAAMIAVSAMPAAAAPPEGIWELETRDTRIQLNSCGDGSQLCGALVWLSDADYNERYKHLLNKPMMERVSEVGSGQWRGKMRLFGHSAQGTITQVSEDQLTLQGCVMLVVCKTYQMYRHAE